MGSKVAVLLILFNLIFFTSVSSVKVPCAPETPKKPKSPPAVKPAKCPKDTLKLGVCADLLGGLTSLVVGTPPNSPCCALLTGLTGLEAALCLCTAVRANVLGLVKLEVPIAISLLVNTCGKQVPEGFTC